MRFLLPLVIALAAPVVAMAQSVEPVRPDDRTLGLASAPATLTAYLSPTCSHCADWHLNDFPAIRAKYVETGQVRVVFRELPTPPIDEAVAGVVMARCAAEDRYDDVLTGLYANRELLRQGQGVAWLQAGATNGGISRERATECFAEDARWEEAVARSEQALADGIDSTPSFFLNGARVAPESGRDAASFDTLLKPLLTP